MKGKWMLIFLVASVTLNLAAVGTFLFNRVIQARRQQIFSPRLRGGAKARVTALFEQMEPQMDSIRGVYWDARRQLGILGFEENPAPHVVDSLLNVIAESHKEMNRLVFETAQRLEAEYPVERRETIRRRLIEMWEGRRERGPRRRHLRPRFPPPWREEMPGPRPRGRDGFPPEGR